MTTHYRYFDQVYGDNDRVAFHIETFDVIKETPSGYWVAPTWACRWGVGDKHKRWVSKTSRKRYCYPNKQQAWDSYHARKHWQAMHIERARRRVEAVHKAIADMPNPPEGDCDGMLRFI
jgi:hypothetical protein